MWRMTEREKRKYAQAERYGLLSKLRENGWAALSAKDAGRIGGAMHGKRKTTK